ncbi:hypothetical protein M8C21_001137 [Ambrosia artemisiifolia]|uniref:Acyl-[acyl-carrier-protein] hydrolase n=1 Tax=Ambrosia artemisiifolia TaxID=4212 RepID=A0AAD5GPQ7_AMBAR|nr:hypothetical protein M8C21_001137 [Ambrosia artemisiifolia]
MLSMGAPTVVNPYNALAHSQSIGYISSHIRPNIFSCKLLSRGSSQSLAMTPDEPSGTREKSPVSNRLQLGGLREDGLSYKEKFVIRCYEVGINKTATIETIANLMQEVGGNHAQCLGYSTDGFSTTTAMRKMHLIETWVQADGMVRTRRDWIIKDCANGEIIGRATSKWVMMNEDTRKLQRVSDEVREEYLVFCPATLRLAFPEENNNSLKKIAKLEDPVEYSRLGLVPRRSDLDMNKHVNNVTYIGWALESIPPEIIDTHELQAITLDYKRECQHDDIVDSLTSHEPISDSVITKNNQLATNKKDGEYLTAFLHLLRSSTNGLEINRARTEWREKKAQNCKHV